MIFKRLVYILMTALVLFADGGQTIYAHTCLKTHSTSLALSNASCCHKKAVPLSGHVFKKPSCCFVNATMVKHGIPAQIQLVEQLKIQAPVSVVLALFSAYVAIPFITILNGRSPSPEPLRAADILFTQVFRC